MIVVVLSITPDRLRGVLTRWLLEIASGVYVGHASARVREYLWQRIVEDAGDGRALMVWSCRSEQGLDFRAHNHSWEPVDLDGLLLMRRRMSPRLDPRSKPRSAQKSSLHPDPDKSGDEPSFKERRVPLSKARARRSFSNAVELRHQRPDSTDRPP